MDDGRAAWRSIFAQLLCAAEYSTMPDSYHSKNTPGNCCPSVHNSLDSQTYPHCTKTTARKLLQVSLILLSPVSDVTSLSKELLCHREAEANWPLLCQEGRGRSGASRPCTRQGAPVRVYIVYFLMKCKLGRRKFHVHKYPAVFREKNEHILCYFTEEF